jgi:O-antigen ligase
MPPQVATLICFGLIGGLFWLDRKSFKGVSIGVWVPLLWIFFAGSRFASQWLELGMPQGTSAEAYSDGSPLDRNIFLALVIAGVWILAKRRVDWHALFARNIWIWLFFIFAALSVLWSDDPFLSFKRWVKGIGNLIAALVLLTDRRPYDALRFVLRRLAFVLVPLSVLFILYYPDLGRTYHMGQPLYTGVTFSKNSLGQLCLIFGMYFCWELILKGQRSAESETRVHVLIYAVMLPSIAWLLHVANCATCSALMATTAILLIAARLPSVAQRPRSYVVVGFACAGLIAALNSFFDIKSSIIRLLGREPDLTTRTPIWDMLLDMASSPWIGAGYESFWSGDRLTQIWARLGTGSVGIIQAHNGYIEVYLSLGLIGVALLVTGMFFGLLRAIRHLEIDYSNAVFALVIIIVVAGYNYTEAAYKPVNSLFVILLFAIIDVPRRVRQRAPVRVTARSARPGRP